MATPNVFGDQFSYERGSLRGEPVARRWARASRAELLLVVISGTPMLRTLERELQPGDVVLFPRGRRGAHCRHRSQEPVRYLMLSTKAVPEVVDEDPADRLMLVFDRDGGG